MHVADNQDESAEFWRNRRVLITGHTGFKGAWLSLWLRAMGAKVTGYALAPVGTPNLWDIVGGDTASIIDDIRDVARVRNALELADPQIVLHLAAQALVRESYRDPLGTYATNVLGTGALLQACRELEALQGVVIVTSDKVYENRGGGEPRAGQPPAGTLEGGLPSAGQPFEEGDRLGGHDPYSNSKACAELLTQSFRESFFSNGPPIATARAGNVIGGGDWSADRLIPDCVRALGMGTPVSLRYPEAVRPWQHVLEPLSGYLMLAQALVQAPERAPRAVNFGPDPASFSPVHEVVDAFSARFAGKPGWVPDPTVHPPEAHVLTLSSSLAERALGWRPRLGMADTLAWTADWYRAYASGEDMLRFSEAQIARYRTLRSFR
jgi:CDP-glucose 4,6-dehydratase